MLSNLDGKAADMGGQAQRDDAACAEAAEASALYTHFARLFLDPVDVPGTEMVLLLRERTELLLENMENLEGAPGACELASWLERMNGLVAQGAAGMSALGDEQQAIAVDRTRLCRGTNPAGPLPPYEAYYGTARTTCVADKTGGTAAGPGPSAPSPSVVAAYRAANLHPVQSLGERDDYAGVELAFLSSLASHELEVRTSGAGDPDRADTLRSQRHAFERDHLAVWIPAYCEAALPHARTTLFKGALALLCAIASGRTRE